MTVRNNGISTGGRNPDGTFAQGNSGRPFGAKHKTTRAIEALLEGEHEQLTRKVMEKALEGDMTAMRLCLERLVPPRKDAPVQFDLPTIESAQEASTAASAVLTAVSEGDITPLEGATLMGLVESYRRSLETSELVDRVAALEEKNKRKRG